MTTPKMIFKEALHFKNQKKEIDFERILVELVKGPVFKYISFGLTAAILARYAKKVQNDFPEVSDFINQNLGLLEEKLNNLRTKIHSNDITQKV